MKESDTHWGITGDEECFPPLDHEIAKRIIRDHGLKIEDVE